MLDFKLLNACLSSACVIGCVRGCVSENSFVDARWVRSGSDVSIFVLNVSSKCGLSVVVNMFLKCWTNSWVFSVGSVTCVLLCVR